MTQYCTPPGKMERGGMLNAVYRRMWGHLNKQFTGNEAKNLGFHLRTSSCFSLPTSTDEGFWPQRLRTQTAFFLPVY